MAQAPKYGVGTIPAHHDRYGQLPINKTVAIANKVLFQVTGKDAPDFAPEFAKEPPTEIKTEDIHISSQTPIFDLSRRHANPRVREFVHMRGGIG
jgi:hypothetical protein